MLKKNATNVKVSVDTQKKHRKISTDKVGRALDILRVIGCVVGGAAGCLGVLYLDRKGYLPMAATDEEKINTEGENSDEA